MIPSAGLSQENTGSMWLRRQPPVRSPLDPRHVARAVRRVARGKPDSREELRRHLAERFRADEVVLCASGTNALELAIRAARHLVRGGPVALPAYTCYDVATATVASGAPVLLYDIRPENLTPDLGSLAAALRRGARVLVVSPLFGFPLDWDAVTKLADAYGAVLVEDAAQGQGASWDGKPLGTLGRLSVVSFGRGKGWTGVRGGACLGRGEEAPGVLARFGTRRAGFASELRVLVSACAQAVVGRPNLYWLPASLPWLGLGETVYRKPEPPEQMTRLAAALLLETESEAAAAAEVRTAVGRELLATLPCVPAVRPVRPGHPEWAGFLRAPVLLSDGMRGFSSPWVARHLGVEASYPSTLADLLPLRTRMEHPVAACPGAEELARHLVTLPTHDGLDEEEREHLLRLIHSYRGPMRWSSARSGDGGQRGQASPNWRGGNNSGFA